MKITIELEKEDYDAMYDVIFEVKGFQPTNDQIQEIWDSLPEHTKGTALQWGCSDSVFRDNMYEWLKMCCSLEKGIN